MNIIIAGYGAVGKAVEAALANHPHVTTYIDDPYLETFGRSFNRIPDEYPYESVDGVIVCVATPMDKHGACDTSNVQDVFDKYGLDTRYLIKSAVDPLFLHHAAPTNTTVSPEFLRGTTGADPTKDFINQEFAIYGGGEMRWWHELFKPVLPKLDTVKFVSMEQAAFAKYVENTFLATKVTFFNQMYMLYQELGFEDFDVMVDAICSEPRLGHSHTQVPGPDGKFGYGGHCFPKDMSAMIELGNWVNADVSFLQSVKEFNEDIRDEDA